MLYHFVSYITWLILYELTYLMSWCEPNTFLTALPDDQQAGKLHTTVHLPTLQACLQPPSSAN